MKKTALVILTALSIFYACKKEDKKAEPDPVTPPNTACTNCPYCVKDTVLADTLIHFKATIDDNVVFTASELHDTIIQGSGPFYDEYITAKNTFVSGNPEFKFHYHSTSSANTWDTQQVLDSTSMFSFTYKINNVTFHSKKGLIKLKTWILAQMLPSGYPYHSNTTMTFCFNTDTINGISHKIKLGSMKIKHP